MWEIELKSQITLVFCHLWGVDDTTVRFFFSHYDCQSVFSLHLSVLEWGKNNFEFIRGRYRYYAVSVYFARTSAKETNIDRDLVVRWSACRVHAELSPLPHNIHLQRSMQRSTA